jgi:hypothetical protein
MVMDTPILMLIPTRIRITVALAFMEATADIIVAGTVTEAATMVAHAEHTAAESVAAAVESAVVAVVVPEADGKSGVLISAGVASACASVPRNPSD